MHADDIDILISEVGPREGAQSIAQAMATDDKRRWVSALATAGLREIEVGSFVSPKRLPQMADTAELVQYATALQNLNVVALVPNLRGAKDAADAAVHAISMPVSASESHSLANIGKTTDEAISEVRRVADFLRESGSQASLEVGISTAFGCTIEGPITEGRVMDIAVKCAEAGAESVGLSDTSGSANPTLVRRMFDQLRRHLGNRAGAAHLHNTRGQGLANVVAALDAGVTTLDSSHAGLGGCPYAPGASGNIVTEDLVYLLESMGLRTGVDLDALIGARSILAAGYPGEPLYGLVPDAGVHKGFSYARKEMAVS